MENSFLRHIAYDSVVFGFSDQKLKILIMEYHNTGWFALPGGFVGTEEDLNQAVLRGLYERTGLENIYLEQFYTFGDYSRFDAQVMKEILIANNTDLEKFSWLTERFISVGYFALIDINNVVPRPDYLSDSCSWYEFDKLPDLILDHKKIVERALFTLRSNLDQKLKGVNLLPEKFTLGDLQRVYEAILGEKLHRGTFQRKMLASGKLARHEKKYTGAANKAPYLYSFLD